MESNKKNELKAVDFFCGAGGMTYGMSLAGIKVLAGIDIDPKCKETYTINNPETKYIQKDIYELTEEELAEVTNIRKNDDSLIFIACSPCQFWTKISTEKEKSKETKDLLVQFQRFVEWFKPGYLVVENVPGLKKHKKEKVLEGFITFLREESYELDDGFIKANNYGVPQTRERYLLMASRVSDRITLPAEEPDENLILRNFIGTHNGFPAIDAGHRDNSDFMHTAANLSEKNKRRIRITPKDGGDRSNWKDNPELQIDAYKGKDHIFRNVYGRMYWDKPASTITTKFHSLSNGRFGHPEEDRAISLREGATLQTFPKDYKFIGSSIDSISRQIGNAVPPELARRIGKEIVENYMKEKFQD
ncbi:MAG TPA: DNA cytosine methyltransferase [Methanosarcina sp.]|nr:DNA cytosine methyltransferase [Methanosarcina sp.]